MKQPARNCRMCFYTALPHEVGRTAAEVANGVLFAQACFACSLVSYMTLAGASEKSCVALEPARRKQRP